jgi:hypothetical protein
VVVGRENVNGGIYAMNEGLIKLHDTGNDIPGRKGEYITVLNKELQGTETRKGKRNVGALHFE